MMLQDIYPSKLNNQYDPNIKANTNDTIIIIEGNDILVRTNHEIKYPKVSDFSNIDVSKLIYIFSVDDENFFLGNFAFISDEGRLADLSYLISLQFELRNLKELRESSMPPKKYIFAAYTAKHLSVWYGNNRFCGRCANSLVHSKTERAMCCPKCNNTIYPKIMPAVIVGVTNGDRILLTKYKRGYNHNALIAGFTEIGETLEETVAREVYEEAGIHVKNIRYYKSQPWGIAGDILAGFYCDVDGDDTITMDDSELKYAEWVYRDDIILQPDESSLTNEMMKLFKDNKEEAYYLLINKSDK